MDGIAEPVIIKDDASRFVFINDAACDLLGKDRNQLIGRTDHDILPWEQADRIVSLDRIVLSTGEGHELEEQITTPDGTQRTLLTKNGA